MFMRITGLVLSERRGYEADIRGHTIATPVDATVRNALRPNPCFPIFFCPFILGPLFEVKHCAVRGDKAGTKQDTGSPPLITGDCHAQKVAGARMHNSFPEKHFGCNHA